MKVTIAMIGHNTLTHAGRGMMIVALSAVLAVIFILSLAFWERMGGEMTQTGFILNSEIATYLAESAAAEALAHVLETANSPGTQWYRLFRKRVGILVLNPVRDIPFTPEIATGVFKSIYGDTAGNCETMVLISFKKIASFAEDPAPDAFEKKGSLHLTAIATVGPVCKRLTVIRDIKVVRVSPPAPLNRFRLWARDSGCIPIAGDPGLSSISGYPEEKNIMEHSWNYRLKIEGTTRTCSGYPLCKEKVSRYFASLADFESDTRDAVTGTYHLDGLSFVKSDITLKLEGAVKGTGAIFTPKAYVMVKSLDIPDGSTMGIITGEDNIRVEGHPAEKPLKADLYAPFGTLYTASDTVLSGLVYARKLGSSSLPLLASDPTSAARYHVSVGAQINSWKVTTE